MLKGIDKDEIQDLVKALAKVAIKNYIYPPELLACLRDEIYRQAFKQEGTILGASQVIGIGRAAIKRALK